MSDPKPNRERLIELRARLNFTQTQAAEILASRTHRPCSLRTVQSWEGPVDASSTRTCPDWCIEILTKEAEKRGC